MNTATLSPEQIDLLPSDSDVLFYQQHGYYHSKKLFTDEEIDTALRGADEFYAMKNLSDVPAVLDSRRPTGQYGDGMRKHDYASFFSHALATLARSPIIGAVAARLSGSPAIRLWHDQLLYKPTDIPGKKANVGWHTDLHYWKSCSSDQMLTAWIPFHDCGAEMGTISMIDGSHLWPDNTEGLDFFSNDLDGLERQFQTGGKPIVKTPINLKKGEVSFHSCLTIHGSGPNQTANPRRSIAVHLQDDSNRFKRYYYPDGGLAGHGNDSLVRKNDEGDPDYTDPAFCPTLFSLK